MQSSNLSKILAMLALLILIVAAVVRFSTSKPPSSEQSQAVDLPRHEAVQRQDAYTPPVRASGHAESTMENESTPVATNTLVVSREKVEAYLQLHNRNAASLLAAYHVSDNDTNYLKEAAMNFPNDAHVQLAVLAHDLFPEDRRKWLDAFKESSPDNSLANYLSAEDYFKNGQPDAAIKELTEASGKTQFADFDLESFQEAADLSQFAEQDPLLATTVGMAAMSNDLLPLLADYKGVAIGLMDLQKQYANSGDAVSVENLSQTGLELADRFDDGDGGRFLIGHLVGMAIESIALKSLDQNLAYDFLGGETPTQRLAELKQEKTDLRQLTAIMYPGFYTLPEAEQSTYFDKMKTDGEIAAMRWLQQQHPFVTPSAQ